jgi:hypothetical protein
VFIIVDVLIINGAYVGTIAIVIIIDFKFAEGETSITRF